MTTKDAVLKRLIDLGLVRNKQDGNRWLIKEKIPSLGEKTAAELIIEGHGDTVLEYIERITDGGYA